MTRLLALVIGVGMLVAGAPARADLSPRQDALCSEVQMANRSAISHLTQRELARISEMIVEGVIETYKRPSVNRPGLAILRVNSTWKGEGASRVALLIRSRSSLSVEPDLPSPSIDPAPDCSNPVQAGIGVRVGATIADDRGNWTSIFSEIDENMIILGGGYLDLIYFPLRDPALERLLSACQAKTDTLRKAASTGNQQAMLTYATHLLDNNEQHRAHKVAAALHRAGVNLAPIGSVLLLDPEQKDWSDLKRIRRGCYSDHDSFDDATFDRADLAECAFRYSSFRNASFRGTDLTGSYFQDSDLTGARYDCATRLPKDLDPKAAGMINVDGKCPVQ